MKKVVFFGERPGKNTDPLRPLFPHTTTGAAAKLIRLLGVEKEEYLENSSRFNVFNAEGEELKLRSARERVAGVMVATLQEHGPAARFVFVGAEALRAAPQFYRNMRFLEIRDSVMFLPHTSGVNRWYNSAENTNLASQTLQSHVLHALTGRSAPTAPLAPGAATARGSGPSGSEEAHRSSRGHLGVATVPGLPPTLPEAGVELTREEFDTLAALWEEETKYASSVHDIMRHPSVPRLLSGGKLSVARAMARLKDGNRWVGWSSLLTQLTGARVVPPEDRGKMEEIRLHWLRWYEKHQ